MLTLSWIFILNNYISYFFYSSATFFNVDIAFITFQRRFIMDKYLDSYREMISLRGLTDHTKKTTAPISGLICII